ncbi:hypothetical protein ACHAW6_001714 [Cyclotella cf. meneghiniana]
MPPKVKTHLERTSATSAWLTTIPDRFSGKELSKTKWLDNIFISYRCRQPHLPSCCDGCGKGFLVEHALNLKKGGLVCIRHNSTHDKWAHLCSLTLSNARVMIKPPIIYGNDSTLEAHVLLRRLHLNLPMIRETKHEETSLRMASGNVPEAPSLTSTSATQMPICTLKPPPTKCWNALPRKKYASMSKPALPNVETSPQ